MSDLNESWEPGFGTIYTWFAMDKNGFIAVMVNYCWGNLPKIILKKCSIEKILDELYDYTFNASKIHRVYPENKNGELVVDLFSAYRSDEFDTKKIIWQELSDDLKKYKQLSDANISVNKGFFVYEAVEGTYQGEDYPVGYDGETKMGDYFRHLVPTIYGSIEDFPEELRHGIAVSDTLDFTKDRVLDNNKINEYFPRYYGQK